jgi:flavin reductase (DIM6/NTAB) family NADH-FMN oxidoreductase RutF
MCPCKSWGCSQLVQCVVDYECKVQNVIADQPATVLEAVANYTSARKEIAKDISSRLWRGNEILNLADEMSF